jgi:signal transduction histidine kinase
MEQTNSEHQIIKTSLSFRPTRKAITILLLGLIITLFITRAIYNNLKGEVTMEFEFICQELKTKIDARLQAHAQLLRSGAAFFVSSDTVYRTEWKNFNKNSQFDKNLPGIQGIGYSQIIDGTELEQHEKSIRKSGFPNYKVYPEGKRNLYSSIIYLEPFSGRNLTAFGYDMYTDPIRRKAMEIARDSDIASLSGKVILVQETTENKQAGTIMYVPVYKTGMPVITVEQRRKALKGWIFSPYRMNDLMTHILGNFEDENHDRIMLWIFDNTTISDEGLLYNTGSIDYHNIDKNANLHYQIPIDFNGKLWTLKFSKNSEKLTIFHGKVLIFFISGIIISLLLFAFSVVFFNTKLRAKQISLLNKQLEKLNSDKDRFISVLAHDLRNPFNTLIGFSDLLVRNIHKYDLDQIEFKTKIIHKTARQTFHLLNELLIWAKSQAGKLPFEPQEQELLSLVNETVDATELQAESKEIVVKYSAIDDIMVFADPNMLKTILRNLVSNAIKFTNHGGKVEIYAEQCKEEVLIKVSDNGIGIRAEAIKTIFKFDENISTRGTDLEKGTGWGLKLCKEFVEKHGGKIWVKSEPGKGSDFFLTLPNKPDQ